jgi:hypothetical protein
MAASYATREDAYKHGLPRGSLAQRPRVVASVDAVLNRIEVEGHGCELDTAIQFAVNEGGALPAPLSASVIYYARPVAGSDSLLEIAATIGGSAIDVTNEGTDPIRLIIPIGPLLDALRETYSRWLDSICIDHEVPFAAPYPAWATHIVAVRVAAQAARALGLGTQGDRLFDAEEQVIKDAMRLAQGTPLRDSTATSPSNLAVFGSAGSGQSDMIP